MQNNLTNEKTIEPKVYGLILESKETVFLSIQYTYSLEEAFILAKLEFEKLNPHRRGINNPLIGSKIGLFTIKSVEELTSPENMSTNIEAAEKSEDIKVLQGISELMSAQGIPTALGEVPEKKVETPVIPISPKEKKNTLMQQIVKTKDIVMFEKHKRLFSKAEKAYLKGHLK